MKSFKLVGKASVSAVNQPIQQKATSVKGMVDNRSATVLQRKLQEAANASRRGLPTTFGKPLPDNLKAGLEQQSGYSLDDVRVHYNSSKPAQVGALAYAQGTNIYLAPGQEKHLAHEAWHVVQQKQGRVQATTQLEDGVFINDNVGLEYEADRMGLRARHNNDSASHTDFTRETKNISPVIQRMSMDEFNAIIDRELPQCHHEQFRDFFKQSYIEEESKGAFYTGGVMYDWKYEKYVEDNAFDRKILMGYINDFNMIVGRENKLKDCIKDLILNDDWNNSQLVEYIGSKHTWIEVSRQWNELLKSGDNVLLERMREFVLIKLKGEADQYEEVIEPNSSDNKNDSKVKKSSKEKMEDRRKQMEDKRKKEKEEQSKSREQKIIEEEQKFKPNFLSFEGWPEMYLGDQDGHKWGTETETGRIFTQLEPIFAYKEGDTKAEKIEKMTKLEEALTYLKRTAIYENDKYKLSIDNVLNSENIENLLAGKESQLPTEIAMKPNSGQFVFTESWRNKALSEEERTQDGWLPITVDNKKLGGKNISKALSVFNKYFIVNRIVQTSFSTLPQQVTVSGESENRLKMADELRSTAIAFDFTTTTKGELSMRPKTSIELLRHSSMKPSEVAHLEKKAMRIREIIKKKAKMSGVKFADEHLSAIIVPKAGIPREVGGYNLTTPMTNAFPLIKRTGEDGGITVLRERR